MDIFEKEKQKFMLKTTCSANGECILWTGCCRKSGYGVARFKDREGLWKAVTAHRLIVMIVLKNYNLESHLDASHLCHNSKCVNIDHITLEAHFENNYRKACASRGKCFGHGTHPMCKLHLRMT